MSSLTEYNGIQVLTPDPCGSGGLALNNNFKALSTHVDTTDPTSSNDTTEHFSTGSRWFNSATTDEWICTDPTQGAAVWVMISLLGPAGPTGPAGSPGNVWYTHRERLRLRGWNLVGAGSQHQGAERDAGKRVVYRYRLSIHFGQPRRHVSGYDQWEWKYLRLHRWNIMDVPSQHHGGNRGGWNRWHGRYRRHQWSRRGDRGHWSYWTNRCRRRGWS
jgi:hypothetical protein